LSIRLGSLLAGGPGLRVRLIRALLRVIGRVPVDLTPEHPSNRGGDDRLRAAVEEAVAVPCVLIGTSVVRDQDHESDEGRESQRQQHREYKDCPPRAACQGRGTRSGTG